LVLPESDVDPLELLEQDQQNALQEYRVLSKATSGGGFLVPTDVGEPD
jgi:hypothetical protein